MIPRLFPTPADWLASLLRRSIRKGGASNVLLAGGDGMAAVGLGEGERLVALIRTGDGRDIFLTGERMIERGRTIIWYGEVVRCHWIAEDRREKARLKHTHYHRLILETKSGERVVVEELGQAVFPLLRFFRS